MCLHVTGLEDPVKLQVDSTLHRFVHILREEKHAQRAVDSKLILV